MSLKDISCVQEGFSSTYKTVILPHRRNTVSQQRQSKSKYCTLRDSHSA